MSAAQQAPETRSTTGGTPLAGDPPGVTDVLFGNAAVALRTVSTDGTILNANRAELELLGYAAEDYVGHNMAEFHVDDAAAREILMRLTRGEALERERTRLYAKDGSIRHVLVSTGPPVRDGGRVLAQFMTIDVSEREELSDRLMLAQEAGEVGTYERDFVTDTMRTSPTFWRLFGVEAGRFGRFEEWLSYVHEDDRDRVEKEMQQAYKTGRYELEYRVVWPNGEVRWLHSRGLAESAPSGQPLRLRGALVDMTDRKAAETALRRQEEELRRVTDTIPALVSYVDARQHFRLANRSYVEWFGRPREEVEGRHVREVLGEAMYETVRPAVERTLRGETTRFEGRRIMPDGSERLVEASYVPRFGRNGRVIGFYAFVNDVTERNRALAKLRAHTSLLATVLETVPAAVWVSEDPEGATIFGSRYAAQLFRRRPEENLSRTPRDGPSPPAQWHFYKDGAPVPLESSPLRRALRGEVVRAEELDLVYDDGTRVTMLLSAAPLFDADSRLTGAVGAGMDISDRARTEEALRARTAELEAILETVPAAILLARGSGGEDIEASRYARALFRTDPGAASLEMGTDGTAGFRVFSEGTEIPDGQLPLQRAARGEDLREEELELRFSDGSAVPLLMNASPLRDETGRIIGSVGAGIDIGERKRAEERQHLLMAELDHRVKNMLSTVMAIVARTASGRRSTADMVETLNGRIMAMARAHERLAANSWEGVNLRELIADELQPYALAERASFGGPDMVLSAKAATALALVLHELATNAAKYGALSRDTGQVSIGWHCDARTMAEAGQMLHLEWAESGGPPAVEPRNRGFGSTLIERTLAFEFEARVVLDWRSTGLCATFSLPLAKVKADQVNRLSRHGGG